MRQRARIPYILGWLLFLGSFIFNVYVAVLVSEIKVKVEEFYQKDFVDIRMVSEQLVRDIEKAYGEKLPPVELNISLSEHSEIGIKYKDNSKTLQLFLPPEVLVFNNNEKRAYLAHEFGHHVLGHIGYQNPSIYSFFGTGDLLRDIEADSFSLKFSSVEDFSWVIKKIVWDENESRTRLIAIGGT